MFLLCVLCVLCGFAMSILLLIFFFSALYKPKKRLQLPPLLYTTLGAAIWNSILALLGYLIYRFTDLKTTNDVYVMATEYSHEIGYVIIAVVVIVIVFLAYKGLKKRK